MTWPSTLGVGIAHQWTERQRISSDVIWVGWSRAFESMGLHLTNADNPIVPLLVGPTITDQFPFNWRGSVSCRFGYEFFVTPQAVLRAGYVYNLNQVPSGTLTPYVPAILEHGFSVGAGRTWNSFSLDMAYQYSFGPRRSVQTSDLVGGDFSGSVLEAQAHWLSVALTRRF